MSEKHIGFIAEDASDINVLKSLAKKLTKKKFTTHPFVGKGCGPLKRKTPGWCKALIHKGCDSVVLVHDLDRNNLAELRLQLETILAESKMKNKIVVIPTEELEAWLLSDSAAIKHALNLVKLPKKQYHPETISSPKEYLARRVKTHSKNNLKQYVNTVHNEKIAEAVDVSLISKSCPSFVAFKEFVDLAIEGKKPKK